MTTLVDSFKNLGSVKMMLITGSAMAVIALFVFATMQISSPGMGTLYNGLPTEDSAKIVSELEAQGIPYQLRGDGRQILVPSDRVGRLRLSMAEKGLPSGGSIVGYEIFDKSEALGTSSQVLNINALRALEGEISRTITAIDSIEAARVHLVMPKRELFSKDKMEPTASVALKLKGNRELSKGEIATITNFVAAAVPELKPSKVTVIDSNGRLLAKGGTDDNSMDAAISTAQEFKAGYENRTKSTLELLLERVVGPGKVNVQVAADMDFDRVVTNSEKYDPESQVARSVQSTSEKEDSKDKEGADSVSVANNLPNSPPAAAAGATTTKQMEKNGETTNYEISKTMQNHIKEGGTIKKLSVAVLVDGIYTDKSDKKTYQPRSEEELQKLSNLIKSAIGFDEKRGDSVEVVNMRFVSEEEFVPEESLFAELRGQMQGVLQTLIIAVVAILAILMVLRPAVQHLVKNASQPADKKDELAALEGPSSMNAARIGTSGLFAGGEEEDNSTTALANVKGQVRTASLKKMNEIVEKHPDETATILRQWILKGA